MKYKTMEERFEDRFGDEYNKVLGNQKIVKTSTRIDDVIIFILQEIELAKKEERDRIVEMIEEVTGEMRTSETDKIINLIKK